MKISKKVRGWCILALTALLALLAFPCLNFIRTQAAGGIDPDKDDCSLTVSVEIGQTDEGNKEYLEDFNQMSIQVSVYRVADVDITGQRYNPTEAFKNMDFSNLSPEHNGDTAERWRTLAQEAEGIRTGAKEPVEAAGTVDVKKQEGSMEAAQGVIGGLTPGLYLVVPEAAYNPDHTVRYTFIPYLTALPGSEYTLTGTGSDEWIYDMKIGLKPEAEPQFGKLNIVKALQNYNETLGQATFVFHIVGVDKMGVTKYDEVASMTYTAAGSNTVTLEGIPAGLNVTVTEVYSGSSYTIVGSDESTALIWSDAAILNGVPGAGEATVTFTNRYDGGNRGGYGVTNHFESDGDGGWIWENPTTPLEE